MAAKTGSSSAKTTISATIASSARLTRMFDAGSGEVLIPSLIPAFTAWLASATVPVPPAAATSSKPVRSASVP